MGIEAKHQELRDRQARDRYPSPDVEDDDADPNYARIYAFREPGSPPLGPRTHTDSAPRPPLSPPMVPGLGPSHSREASGEDALDGLYARVNKQRGPPGPSLSPPSTSPDSSMDRIQQLRREYHQAQREGAAPAYDDLDPRRRGPEYDPHRMPVRGPEQRLAPRYEDVERQYASLPRRGPMDPGEYPMQPWGGGGGGSPHRDPGHYPSPPQQASPNHHPHPHPQPHPHPHPHSVSHPHPHPGYALRDGYPTQGVGDPRQADPGYYSPPPPPVQPRGPLRQDVPPSPPVPVRAPRYDTLNRGPPGAGGPGGPGAPAGGVGGPGGYRQASPERYAYGDPRHKNAMTAAV
ncbi:partitioning defective 3 homolog B-like [Engraulis encrasicolus]|uniref:partitioning defective 3 homolog B-like n=1 Tax=Engraulis encrasicolus TaxID=184585 RepID=UPI002FCF56BF